MKRNGLMMSVLVVIGAIAASTMCPISWAQQEPPMTDDILTQLSGLKTVISEFAGEYQIFTVTNTAQQANALYHKIDAVTMKVEAGEYLEAATKLENDVAPKLNICDTQRDQARSWLSADPQLQPIVEEFEGICQQMINDMLIALNRLMND